MKIRRSLHAQIMYWLTGYAVLLTAAVALHGTLVNEYAEDLVWESLLERELSYYLQRLADDPDYQWHDTELLQLYGTPARPLPPAVSALTEGVHDDFWLDQRQTVVLVRRVNGADYALALDITKLEAHEFQLTLYVIGLALALVLAIAASIAWGLRRLLRPLSRLADDIGALAPDLAGQRVAVDAKASSELFVIANALNDYLRRQEAFVERERAFNETASHELRTPIAVIAGASELALEQPALPQTARLQVQRVLHTARNAEQLIALLLTLAKDPARLRASTDQVAVHELLPEVIDDLRHLMQGKALRVVVDELAPCVIQAPLHIVQAAVGNLLRNAIENSDQGTVHVSLDAGATVIIRDPGHGMTPEEISRIYAQMARGGGREAGGIGLDLLSRLCEHLGWRLSIESVPGRGTISRLTLRSGNLRGDARNGHCRPRTSACGP
ncbi:MAG: sensor histidine kinase [Burkholderiaceae bacterium]